MDCVRLVVHRAEVIFFPGIRNAVVICVNKGVIARKGQHATGGQGVGLARRRLIKRHVAELHGVRTGRRVADGGRGQRARLVHWSGEGETALSKIFRDDDGSARARGHPGDADIVHQPAVELLADVNSLIIPNHLDGFSHVRRQVDRFLFPSIRCLPGIIHQRGNRAWGHAAVGADAQLAVLQTGTEIETVPEREGGLAHTGEINHRAVKKTAGQEAERLAVEIAPPRVRPRMRAGSRDRCWACPASN